MSQYFHHFSPQDWLSFTLRLLSDLGSSTPPLPACALSRRGHRPFLYPESHIVALDPEPQPSRAQAIQAAPGGPVNEDMSSGRAAALHVPDGPPSVGQGLRLVFLVMAVDLCSSVPSRI